MVGWKKVANNLRNYLRIAEAARLLGVSEATSRNWGRQGKIKTHRHPINSYQLFKRADLDDFSLRCEAFRPTGEALVTTGHNTLPIKNPCWGAALRRFTPTDRFIRQSRIQEKGAGVRHVFGRVA